MAQKSFLYVEFSPPVWREGPLAADGSLSRVVAEKAPAGVNREQLKTTFDALPSAHDAFDTYSVRHDIIRSTSAYTEATSDVPSPDEVVEISIAQPHDFHLYELRNAPTHVYITSTVTVARRVYRRARDTRGGQDLALRTRKTNLWRLETALRDAKTIGYKLLDVQFQPPLRVFDVEAEDIALSTAVQAAKRSAERMRVLKVRIQHQGETFEVWINEDGSVAFKDYPGDDSGLGLLDYLTPTIAGCSEPELATVR